MDSAVEWLFDKMFDESWNIELQKLWLEEAKEMEKQQLEKVYQEALREISKKD